MTTGPSKYKNALNGTKEKNEDEADSWFGDGDAQSGKADEEEQTESSRVPKGQGEQIEAQSS